MESVPDCRLYLPVPAAFSRDFEEEFAKALAEADVASILLVGDPNQQSRESIHRLRDLAVAHEVAFLVDGNIELSRDIDADGVHLPPDPHLYRQARDALGQRAIIGVGSVDSRHVAMVLAELGADYVAIGPEAGMAPGLDQAELIAWWSEIFVVPCVAWDVETPEDAEMLARFGADFIAPSITIWQHANPVNAILALEEAIETGRSIA